MFGIAKAKGEICQYWYDEISALAIFLLHIELLPQYSTLSETGKWKLEDS
jgi:hypothetical protein